MKAKMELGTAQILANAIDTDPATIQKDGLKPEQLGELFDNIPHDKRNNPRVILGRGRLVRMLSETLERGEIDDEIASNLELAEQMSDDCERAGEVLRGRIRRCEQTKARLTGGSDRA